MININGDLRSQYDSPRHMNKNNRPVLKKSNQMEGMKRSNLDYNYDSMQKSNHESLRKSNN